MLPLVSLSGYGREAAILREPLRLVTLDESVDEDKVVARLEAGDDGIGRVAYGEDEELMELGYEKRSGLRLAVWCLSIAIRWLLAVRLDSG
jgi:hypothetical protein